MNIRRILRGIKRRVVYLFQGPSCYWPREKLIAGNMRDYKHWMGRTFDLSHPERFSEKIVWYKLFYERPDLPNILDKYLFKDYIAAKLGPGYTAPLYGMWTDMRSFKRDWDSLPDAFVLKSNCSASSRNLRGPPMAEPYEH